MGIANSPWFIDKRGFEKFMDVLQETQGLYNTRAFRGQPYDSIDKDVLVFKIDGMVSSIDFYKRFGVPSKGFEYTYMMVLKVPEWITNNIPQIPKRIYCNKQMEVPLLVAFYNIIDRDLESEVKTWDGCFNVRPIRGYEEKHKQAMLDGNLELAMRYLSTHAWGCALDLNAKENPLGRKGKMSDELGKCFEDAGFTWGKHFSRADFMHFQLSYIK